MNKNENILVCKSIRFYSLKDEDAFFEWIKKIACIDKISAASDELYLHVTSNKIHDTDLDDLLALFYRYKVDMRQLRIFLTADNKEWFYENERAYWRKKVFGKPQQLEPKK